VCRDQLIFTFTYWCFRRHSQVTNKIKTSPLPKPQISHSFWLHVHCCVLSIQAYATVTLWITEEQREEQKAKLRRWHPFVLP
jgi:hypothetical protein